jgi:hypothetical protein
MTQRYLVNWGYASAYLALQDENSMGDISTCLPFGRQEQGELGRAKKFTGRMRRREASVKVPTFHP